MGGSDSKQEVQSNGQVTNTVLVNDKVNVYNNEMFILLCVLVALKIIQLVLYLYSTHVRGLKKKIGRNQVGMQNGNSMV